MASAVSDMSLPDSLLAEEPIDEDEEDIEIKYKDLQEASSRGKVHGSLFWKYLSAGGNICFVLIVLILYVITQITASGVDYFVSFWTNIEEFRNVTINNSTGVYIKSTTLWSTEFCLYVYGGLIVGLFIFAFARSMLFYKLAMISSQKLHDNLFNSIISVAMRFFDTNPSGRILNRFSKDMGAVDEVLPKIILDAGQVRLSSSN